MPPMPTVILMRPIATVCLVPAVSLRTTEGRESSEPAGASPPSDSRLPTPENEGREWPRPNEELAELLATLRHLTDSLHKLYEQTVAHYPAEIARLAVEIARRVLRHRVSQGDYEIQALVEEALQEAPTQQDVVIHLHPEDLALCQAWQQQNPQSPLAGLELTADRNIGRGECLVETPKGIVESFLEERLERISEALRRVP